MKNPQKTVDRKTTRPQMPAQSTCRPVASLDRLERTVAKPWWVGLTSDLASVRMDTMRRKSDQETYIIQTATAQSTSHSKAATGNAPHIAKRTVAQVNDTRVLGRNRTLATSADDHRGIGSIHAAEIRRPCFNPRCSVWRLTTAGLTRHGFSHSELWPQTVHGSYDLSVAERRGNFESLTPLLQPLF